MEFGEGEVSETARSGAGVLYYGDMLLVRTALSLHCNNIKGRIRGGFLEENLNGVVTRVAPRASFSLDPILMKLIFIVLESTSL